jgi:hypothetical protein
MTQPTISNFSLPADNDHIAVLTIASSTPGDTLVGCTVYLRIYEQTFGVPTAGVDHVLEKSSLSGGDITILASPPMTVSILFTAADTLLLLRNYYYEVTVVDEIGDLDTVTVGILTVTGTENRIP